MKHSPSCESKSSSASQEIPRILWILKVQCHIHSARSLSPTWFYNYMIYFNAQCILHSIIWPVYGFFIIIKQILLINFFLRLLCIKVGSYKNSCVTYTQNLIHWFVLYIAKHIISALHALYNTLLTVKLVYRHWVLGSESGSSFLKFFSSVLTLIPIFSPTLNKANVI
jgi:hypothetical protein